MFINISGNGNLKKLILFQFIKQITHFEIKTTSLELIISGYFKRLQLVQKTSKSIPQINLHLLQSSGLKV